MTGVFNVLDYRAPNSDVLDSNAIQRAVDDAIGPGDPAKVGRLARGEVVLPPGIYQIDKPIKIWSVSYLKFRGISKGTRLHPVETLDSILDINGAAFCTFSDLLLEGDEQSPVEDAIAYYHDPATAARTASGNVFSNLQIQNVRFTTGFRVGKAGSLAGVDTTTYDNVLICGPWSNPPRSAVAGFLIGTGAWGNNCIHSLRDCGVANCQVGVHVWAASGFQHVGGSFSQNGVDFQLDTTSYCRIQGVRSEESGRFMATGLAPTGITCNISLADILVTLDRLEPDNQVIEAGCNGVLAIQNFVTSGEPRPAVLYLAPFRSCALLLDGATTANTLDGFLSGCNVNVDKHVRGYVQLDPDGSLGIAQKGVLRGNVLPQPAPRDLTIAGDLVVGGTIKGASLNLGEVGSWTSDGLSLSGQIKQKGCGSVVFNPTNGGLYFVSWDRQSVTVLVKPWKGK